MDSLATTKMSSKGQIVIPEKIRRKLGLNTGDQFLVVGQDAVVILKAISPPAIEEFDDIIADARRQAERTGMKRADVAKAKAKVRRRK